MSADAPTSEFCAAQIRRAVSPLARTLRPNLQRDQISTAKLSVIGQIYRAGKITPSELASREKVKLQTLTRLLAELTADRWVSRRQDKIDGRQTVLSLTARGRARLIDAATAADASLAEVIERTLSEADRNLLLRACEMLLALDEALAERSTRSSADERS
ncbi:MarR family winged helix-turn-helix transcriptional regulator [Methylocapsa sp. S129]|uniref:MarR family winged helix-turn-helix transcriptional regulator n=1 Tax=Methylocapsa sp. S129 TaxID=1641869 RepID=UPI00131C0CAC|nr:MarR family transcriptional regulator [Methylocapsa sp. S129]